MHYIHVSINSLTEKASRFLSFSLIIKSIVAGYIGAIFYLTNFQVENNNPTAEILSTSAAMCLFLALILLLVVIFIAARSLRTKLMIIPMHENLDEATSRCYMDKKEFFIEYQHMLIESIRLNDSVCKNLARNVNLMSLITLIAAFFFMLFTVLILLLALFL